MPSADRPEMSLSRLSIIIPACNEEARIGACLTALLAQDAPGAALQVIVVPNGCRDDTAGAARQHAAAFAARGWSLKVLERDDGGKIGALNAADAQAAHPARLYLDADIVCGPGLIQGLLAALDRPEPVYAGARLVVAPPRSAISRHYARFWQGLPFLTRGVSGAGLFAVNAAGRKRWDAFPSIIADDAFVRGLFAPRERVMVDAAYTWPISEGFGALVRVRGRQDDGMRELARLYPALMRNFEDRPGRAELRRLALADPAGFATYATVNLATRLRRKRGVWARSR